MPGQRCQDCGTSPASFVITGLGRFCDWCADRHLSPALGWPLLPEPPDPVVITGPDRRRHTLRFRIWRAPTGISVELREQPRGDDREGYEFAVLGAHDADTTRLIEQVVAQARAEIGHQYLHRDRDYGWGLGDDDQVAGRITCDPSDGAPRVVIDGRELDWDELGKLLASCYEGWRFRLVLDDRCEDLRPDAQLLHLNRPDRVPPQG